VPSALLALSLIGIAGHNLLDGIRPESFGAWAPLWKVLHVQGPMPIGFVHYPLVPWVFVMALSYSRHLSVAFQNSNCSV
jgi:uncharacterized membrane protein